MQVHGIQFLLERDDYREKNFLDHVERFYRKTQPGDVIVFPEDIGLLTAFASPPEGNIGDIFMNLYNGNEKLVENLAKTYSDADTRELLFASFTSRFVERFYRMFSELSSKYAVYTVACNDMAEFREEGGKIVPTSPRIFNTAFVFGTNGKEMYRQRKVFLTEMENMLSLTPGPIEKVSTFRIGGIEFGIAISLDAFIPEYVSRLSSCEVILQPDANPERWTSYLQNGRWQPEEWMDSAYFMAQRIGSAKYVINPMMVGNLGDVRFEGQSAILKKAEASDELMGYAGNIPTTGFKYVSGIGGLNPSKMQDRTYLSSADLTYGEDILTVEL